MNTCPRCGVGFAIGGWINYPGVVPIVPFQRPPFPEGRISEKIPDSIKCTVGWRSWQVGDDGRLTSINYRYGEAWAEKSPEMAWCASHGWDTPNINCVCGIYAARIAETAMKYGPIVGRVRLWGKIVDHDDGWRGQYAYPEVVFADGPLAQKIAERYGIVVRPRSDLLKEIERNAAADNAALMRRNRVAMRRAALRSLGIMVATGMGVAGFLLAPAIFQWTVLMLVIMALFVGIGSLNWKDGQKPKASRETNAFGAVFCAILFGFALAIYLGPIMAGRFH